MSRPNGVAAWVAPTTLSLALLVVVLIGSIVTVSMLSIRNAITLVGGIAVFAVSVTAWLVVTVAIVSRSLRRWRQLGADGSSRPGIEGLAVQRSVDEEDRC
jgi:hypothetical protein